MKQSSKKASWMKPVTFIKWFLTVCTIAVTVIALGNPGYVVGFAIIAMIIPGGIIFALLHGQHEIQKQKELDLQEEKRQKEFKEIDAKQNQLFETLTYAEKPNWADIRRVIATLGFSHNPEAMYKIIAKADLTDLFVVSLVKNEITWNSTHLNDALGTVEKTLDKCNDDAIIEKVISNVKRLERYSEFEGYESLVTLIGIYPSIRDFYRLKFTRFSLIEQNLN